ncbi:unnamed protein product [Ambrosiozyma monospora]|uniref:Unnamed protein product n=1 Tax=Ambrosiozyma monospora TaxID=43982 RepID=A0A9W7DI95_AMBMO|nr:unnamed protein product [Ambrosiozyma monospora]
MQIIVSSMNPEMQPARSNENTSEDVQTSLQDPVQFLAREDNETGSVHLSPVQILEDDRFKLGVPSKIDWTKFMPKLKEPQLHLLQPSALHLIHKTYIELIDSKNTSALYQFTISQFLQFLLVYLPFLKLKFSSPTLCYILCPIRFKCKATLSITFNTVKGLFYLKHTRTPYHSHTSGEIVELAKMRYASLKSYTNFTQTGSHGEPIMRQKYLRVNIPEDDRFTLSKLTADSSMLLPQLREDQPKPKPSSLRFIHETYSNVIDLKDAIHVFTASQFLQFLAVYIPFLRPTKGYGSKGYLNCVSRFKCKASLSWRFDLDQRVFFVMCSSDPVHTHSSAEIVEMTKMSLIERFGGSHDEQTSSNPHSLQFPKGAYFPVNIPEDNRFKLELPSIVNWTELGSKLRIPQLYELQPDALDSIHKTYTDLIDLKNTGHIFTTSQFLQFLSVYHSFLRIACPLPPSAYLYCTKRLKCKKGMTIKLDTQKGLFYLKYSSTPFHDHTSSKIVKMAKAEYAMRFEVNDEQEENRRKILDFQLEEGQYSPVDIPEDEKFTFSLKFMKNWPRLLLLIRNHQPDELRPEALDLIHETYTKVIESSDKTYIFTLSQLVQFITLYSKFMKMSATNNNNCYVFCAYRLGCKAKMSLKFDTARNLFFLKYLCTPVHKHTAAEIVKTLKLDYGKGTGLVDERDGNADDENQVEDGLIEEFNAGSSNGNNQALRVHATSRLVTLNFSTRGAPNRERPANDDHEEPVQILVEDNGYVFSDHESLDHENEDEEGDGHCNDNGTSQELDTYTGAGQLSTEQIARISKVTHSLLFEPERFANSANSDMFQQKLEGLLYYAKKLNNCGH